MLPFSITIVCDFYSVNTTIVASDRLILENHSILKIYKELVTYVTYKASSIAYDTYKLRINLNFSEPQVEGLQSLF